MNLISTTVLIQKIEVGHPLTKLHNNHTEYTNVTDLISLYIWNDLFVELKTKYYYGFIKHRLQKSSAMWKKS